MQKTVSALAVRRNLGELLDSSYYRGDEFIIERSGRPMAALIPLKELERLQELRRKSWAVLDRLRARQAGVDAKQVAKDVEAAVRKVREESDKSRR